jgi:hypothetical protein
MRISVMANGCYPTGKIALYIMFVFIRLPARLRKKPCINEESFGFFSWLISDEICNSKEPVVLIMLPPVASVEIFR